MIYPRYEGDTGLVTFNVEREREDDGRWSGGRP
jgi:hypothetical protein